MASLNSVSLLGNLGKDPEIKTMTSGDKVANFSMAMTENWTKDGEKKERTEWVNVVIWGNGLVGVIEKYVSKGSKIYVQGQLRTRKYEKDGQDRYVTEVVVQGIGGKVILLDGKKDGASGGGDNGSSSGGSSGGYDKREDFAADLDDEIPFVSQNEAW